VYLDYCYIVLRGFFVCFYCLSWRINFIIAVIGECCGKPSKPTNSTNNSTTASAGPVYHNAGRQVVVVGPPQPTAQTQVAPVASRMHHGHGPPPAVAPKPRRGSTQSQSSANSIPIATASPAAAATAAPRRNDVQQLIESGYDSIRYHATYTIRKATYAG